jgi:hypothetical protein
MMQAGTFSSDIDCCALDATQRVYLALQLLHEVLSLLHLLLGAGELCSSVECTTPGITSRLVARRRLDLQPYIKYYRCNDTIVFNFLRFTMQPHFEIMQ